MPWNLEIRTIDVAQGESSLVRTFDTAGPQRRTMLIDGGKAGQARTVSDYLTGVLGADPVDHILITHYDVDHSGGIIALLEADNFYTICQTIAAVAAFHAPLGANRAGQIAGTSAAICACIMGAYNDPLGANHSATANVIAAATRLAWGVAVGTDAQAARFGIDEAEDDVRGLPLNSLLVPTTIKRRDASRLAAIAAVTASIGGFNVQDAAFNAVFNCLRSVVSSKPQFNTHGRFNNSGIIDTGNPAQIPGTYVSMVAGGVYMGSTLIQAPGINRQRTQPLLSTEVLWNSGPNAMAAPANAPAIFVMARNGFVWDGPGNAPTPVGGIAIDNNKDSYGLILRFNNFFFYTGGDLPSAGEDLIADAINQYGLPNGVGGTYALPNRVAAFKCGHHGANTCTSAYFLGQINPRAAFISCGQNGYGHPEQNLVDRLDALNPFYFYLTGCYPIRNHIPASYNPVQNQLAGGNRSRVAGGIMIPPGNINMQINQANSLAAVAPQFQVTYYDYDAPAAYRTEINPF